ncbi:phospholipase B1, membrane-associated-like [Ceratina calcarata]|uniref:Phospholipase B1, membrane-associated-like n=1 Tax=Ceratina calcarata TaxID=156304 RepID=A0AAJ7IZS8_9HYME|nr:phospholipase B1, membrane-associated-like [Ceratina calcarata]
MDKVYFCILLLSCVLVACERTNSVYPLDTPALLQMYRLSRAWFFQTYGRNEQRSYSGKTGRVQEEIPSNVPFPCNVTGGRSAKVPDSVNRLRPGDIDVIAGMGDSLTAGHGLFARDLLESRIENRGASGAIGGERTWRTYLTLPNILKEFNPNLIGYALGDSQTIEPKSQLNVAEIGAISKDMPFMSKHLVDKMKNDSRIDINRHWKMISLLFGSNDFCTNICTDPPLSSVERHRTDLVEALRILRDNLPRTFVTVNVSPHLKILVDANKERFSLKCYLLSNLQCPCLFGTQYKNRREEYYDLISRWQEVEEEVVAYPEFHKNDFTVVALPTLKRIQLPLAEDGLADPSYLSSDCFHVSQKTNALYANGLWNNLLEPVGNKTNHTYPIYERFLCPTEDRPFFMTRENSPNNNEFRTSQKKNN